MNSSGLLGYMGESKRVTWEDLKEELSTQLEEVRGKMHDFIDVM